MRRYILLLLLSVFLISLPGSAWSGNITPSPKMLEGGGIGFRLKNGIMIAASEECLPVASYLADEISKRTGVRPKLSSNGEIIIKKIPEAEAGGIEGYSISTDTGHIIVSGGSSAGALYGIRTLLMTLEKDTIGYYFKAIRIKDHPDIAIRALHLPLISNTEYLKETISRAADFKFNTLFLMVDDMVIYKSHPELARPGAISRETLSEIVSFARGLGMEVIPHIQLLTHQKDLFKSVYPELMINGHTYNPDRDEVYVIVSDLLDEMIGIFKPRYFHIGHDEVWGVHWATAKDAEEGHHKVLGYEGFVKDINKIHDYLMKKNIRTIIWGDMLLNPSMFPNMEWKSLHGTNGFNKSVEMIPQDVIIADGHYYDINDFSSMKYLQDKGFKVFGSTWDNRNNILAFSKYASEMHPSPLGMIATTWFHFNRMEEDKINEIIEWSGEAYWNAGKR